MSFKCNWKLAVQLGRAATKPRFEPRTSDLRAHRHTGIQTNDSFSQLVSCLIPGDDSSRCFPFPPPRKWQWKLWAPSTLTFLSWFTLASLLLKVVSVACALDLFSFRFPWRSDFSAYWFQIFLTINSCKVQCKVLYLPSLALHCLTSEQERQPKGCGHSYVTNEAGG